MDYLFTISINNNIKKYKIKNCTDVADGKLKAMKLFISLGIINISDVTESKEKKYDLPDGWQDIFGDILK